MALIRTNGGAGGGTLNYTVESLGSVPVGGKTVDLSSYGNIAFVAYCSGNPETSNAIYNSYVISQDGGNSAAFTTTNNATIGGLTLSNKSLTIKNDYSSAITDSYLVVGTI